MGLAFYGYWPPLSSLLFLFFLPSLHSLCMHVWLNKLHSWHMPGYGSAGKLYILPLLVKQLGAWIGCVFRANHEVHRANKALKQLPFYFLSYIASFFTTEADLLQVTIGFVCLLKIFSFSDREKILGDALLGCRML